MTDYEYPPQRKHKRKVRLLSRENVELFNGRLEVWSGEPIGDWVEFRQMRIALKRLPHDKFEGIVPDDRGPDE